MIASREYLNLIRHRLKIKFSSIYSIKLDIRNAHVDNTGVQIARRPNEDHNNLAKMSARVINTYPESADEIYLPHVGWISVSRITSRRKYCSVSIFNKLAAIVFVEL